MGKTITGMRTALRLDLKDSGALWSDAELDRCVERAVADLSRFLPLEKSYELTVAYDVSSEAFTTPAAADPDYIVDNEDIASVTDGDTCTLATRTMDVPRPVAILITDADTSITAFTIIVKGTDRDGNYVEESFYFSGGLSQTGKKEFNTIVEVELDQMSGEGASDVLDVGTSNAYDVYVQLANKPIRPKSESITGYSRDTDYIMDYANGRIKYINGGSMAAGTAYTIASYDKSRIEIDLAPIKHELIRVDRLIYPASDMPQTFISADIWGDILTLGGGAAESQSEMSNDQHAVIRYLATHTPPSVDAPGSYPDFLDNTVILAASAYALFIEALQYEQQAVTDLASVRTELGLTTAVHTLADAALDKVITYLENNSNEDAKYWLTKITTDIAGLRTAIGTAVDAANAYLDEVDTTDLGQATVGAEGYLATGDDKINTINIGDRVPENYREYSEARVAIANARLSAALGFIQEANVRLSNLRTYIEQAGGWVSVAETFIAEAAARIAELDRYLTEAAQYQAAAEADMALADRFKAEAIERRNEAWSIWHDPKQYIGDFTLTPTRQPGRYNSNA